MAERHTEGFIDSIKNYEEAKREGVDAPFIEYLTLPAMISIGLTLGIHERVGYSRKCFKELGRLRNLRNAVAHPVRSLITNPSSSVKLWEKLQLIEDFLTEVV